MAQLVVRNLEESVKRRLRQRAVKNGRSLEGEVREILKLSVKVERGAKSGATEKRLGTQCDMTRLSP
jgi:antitoxin FitA